MHSGARAAPWHIAPESRLKPGPATGPTSILGVTRLPQGATTRSTAIQNDALTAKATVDSTMAAVVSACSVS